MRLLVITQKVDKEDENLGFFYRWIEEFAKHFSEVHVIANQANLQNIPPRVFVSILEQKKKGGRIKKLFRFWELFSANYAKSDAVFFHMIPEFVVAASPFLLSSHRLSALWYVHKSVTLKLKLAERLVDFVLTASELSFRMPSKKVIYLGHAIDTEMFRPNARKESYRGGLRLLILGRISPVKDIETTIHTCAILREKFSRPWSLSIVGGPLMPRDHNYLSSLKELAHKKGLDEYVHFQGPRPYTEVPSLYQEHDMFISMSRTGSIDKSVLEAMSSGLTVITANEAFKDLLPEKYFLEQRSPEFLAERIKMLTDENRPNLALRTTVVEKHSLEKTIGKIAQILKTKF